MADDFDDADIVFSDVEEPAAKPAPGRRLQTAPVFRDPSPASGMQRQPHVGRDTVTGRAAGMRLGSAFVVPRCLHAGRPPLPRAATALTSQPQPRTWGAARPASGPATVRRGAPTPNPGGTGAESLSMSDISGMSGSLSIEFSDDNLSRPHAAVARTQAQVRNSLADALKRKLCCIDSRKVRYAPRPCVKDVASLNPVPACLRACLAATLAGQPTAAPRPNSSAAAARRARPRRASQVRARPAQPRREQQRW